MSPHSYLRRLLPAGLASAWRRFPFVFPRGTVTDTRAWLRARAGEREWYAATQLGEAYVERYPASPRVFPQPPANLDRHVDAFRNAQIKHAPAAAVFLLREAWLAGGHGAILGSDFRFLADFSHWFDHGPARRNPLLRAQNFRQLRPDRTGETIGLLAAPESTNHYHFLFDLLPRLHLLAPYRDSIERWAVPPGLSPLQVTTLERLGVPRDRLLELRPNGLLHVNRLIAPSLPGSVGAYPDWSIEFLRQEVAPLSRAGRAAGPRLFVRRGSASSRPALDEDRLIARLVQHGFIAIDPGALSLDDQIASFAAADCIVGVHGAALANLVFCRPGTRVVEICSADYLRPEIYWTLAHLLGLRHQTVMLSRGPDEPWGSVRLNPESILPAISNCLASS